MGKVIAEIGSVPDGSYGNAIKLIKLCASVGVDVVKFQTHIADAETVKDASSLLYFSEESRYAYFKRTEFNQEQWQGLFDCAKEHDIEFVSSPFSLEAVDLLENIGIEAYKVASGEVSNIPLLEAIAATGKPVYLSSGMSNWQEIDRAISVLQPAPELVLMQCISAYPCSIDQVGLNLITEFRQRYNATIGFSDHTPGYAAAIVAVTLGATVVEKHITFSRHMYGSDAKNAMEPREFAQYIKNVREAWQMLVKPVQKDDLTNLRVMKNIFEKSIVLACDINAGTMLERKHLAFKKPGDGISAAEYSFVLGKKVIKKLPKDHQLSLGDLQ